MTDANWEAAHQAWIAERCATDPVIGYLATHGAATIAELAHIGDTTLERIVANMGGLHDYGIVTKFGNEPQSIVRWDHHD